MVNKMRSAICKIFSFILDLFNLVIDAVAIALNTVGTVAVELLSAVAESVGEALGINGSTVLWLGLGAVAIYFLFSSKDNGSQSELTRSRSVVSV